MKFVVGSGQVRPRLLAWPLTLCGPDQAMKKNLARPASGPFRVGSGRPSGQPGLALPADSVELHSLK